MAMIKGTKVTLYERVKNGEDEFGHPIHTEISTEVENVLIAPASTDDVVNSLNLYGKKVVYNLGIPKGDSHNWENARVDFFGQSFKTFGFVVEGIEENIPLDWNKKVSVERYG